MDNLSNVEMAYSSPELVNYNSDVEMAYSSPKSQTRKMNRFKQYRVKTHTINPITRKKEKISKSMIRRITGGPSRRTNKSPRTVNKTLNKFSTFKKQSNARLSFLNTRRKTNDNKSEAYNIRYEKLESERIRHANEEAKRQAMIAEKASKANEQLRYEKLESERIRKANEEAKRQAKLAEQHASKANEQLRYAKLESERIRHANEEAKRQSNLAKQYSQDAEKFANLAKAHANKVNEQKRYSTLETERMRHANEEAKRQANLAEQHSQQAERYAKISQKHVLEEEEEEDESIYKTASEKDEIQFKSPKENRRQKVEEPVAERQKMLAQQQEEINLKKKQEELEKQREKMREEKRAYEASEKIRKENLPCTAELNEVIECTFSKLLTKEENEKQRKLNYYRQSKLFHPDKQPNKSDRCIAIANIKMKQLTKSCK